MEKAVASVDKSISKQEAKAALKVKKAVAAVQKTHNALLNAAKKRYAKVMAKVAAIKAQMHSNEAKFSAKVAKGNKLAEAKMKAAKKVAMKAITKHKLKAAALKKAALKKVAALKR